MYLGPHWWMEDDKQGGLEVGGKALLQHMFEVLVVLPYLFFLPSVLPSFLPPFLSSFIHSSPLGSPSFQFAPSSSLKGVCFRFLHIALHILWPGKALDNLYMPHLLPPLTHVYRVTFLHQNACDVLTSLFFQHI